MCRRIDRTDDQVAKDFDLIETAVRQWVKQADLDAGTRTDGLTSDERAKLAALRRENRRRLREDVEILKRPRLFRDGEPVKVHPFIEAEKQNSAAGGPGNVARACAVLKVTRSAFDGMVGRHRPPGPPRSRTRSPPPART